MPPREHTPRERRDTARRAERCTILDDRRANRMELKDLGRRPQMKKVWTIGLGRLARPNNVQIVVQRQGPEGRQENTARGKGRSRYEDPSQPASSATSRDGESIGGDGDQRRAHDGRGN